MKFYQRVSEGFKFLPRRIKEIKKGEVSGNLKSYYEGRWSNFVKDYVSCGIGESLLSAPVFAFFETWVPKVIPFAEDFGVEFSKTQRVGWAVTNFLLFGYLSNKARDFSRWFFKYDDSQKDLVDSEGKKKKVFGHDGKLGLVVGTLSSGIGYALGKNGGTFSVLSQTGVSSGSAYITGATNGLANDIMRECLNIKHSRRLPEWIKNSSKQTKYGLIGLMMMGSVLSTKAIYSSYDYFFEEKNPHKKEIEINPLEKKSLELSFSDFNGNLIKDYVPPIDGLRVKGQKYFDFHLQK